MSKPIPLPWKEVFCINCRRFRPFYTEIEPTSEMIPTSFTSAVKLVFPVVTSHCAACGEELYVPDIHDRNMDVRRQAWIRAMEKAAEEDL